MIAALAAAGTSVSLMQTLVIPLVPQLPMLLNTSSTNIAGLEAVLSRWDHGDVALLIGYLGRLSDGSTKRAAAGGRPTRRIPRSRRTPTPNRFALNGFRFRRRETVGDDARRPVSRAGAPR